MLQNEKIEKNGMKNEGKESDCFIGGFSMGTPFESFLVLQIQSLPSLRGGRLLPCVLAVHVEVLGRGDYEHGCLLCPLVFSLRSNCRSSFFYYLIPLLIIVESLYFTSSSHNK